MDRYIWRDVEQGDIEALEGLDSACKECDGPAWVAGPTYRELLSTEGVALLCATLTRDSRQVVAVGWAQLRGSEALLGGKVHPEHRHRGLGTGLLRRSEKATRALATPVIYRISNENFNSGSQALYAQEGYSCDSAKYWMERSIEEEMPAVAQPLCCVTWSEENALRFLEVYVAAFKERERPGYPLPDAGQWLRGWGENRNFRPDLSRLAVIEGHDAGFLIAEVKELPHLHRTVALIELLAVHPAWRRRGIATSLIADAMHSFRGEGFSAVSLHVNSDNAGAMDLYGGLGFGVVGRRARYSKQVEQLP